MLELNGRNRCGPPVCDFCRRDRSLRAVARSMPAKTAPPMELIRTLRPVAACGLRHAGASFSSLGVVPNTPARLLQPRAGRQPGDGDHGQLLARSVAPVVHITTMKAWAHA